MVVVIAQYVIRSKCNKFVYTDCHKTSAWPILSVLRVGSVFCWKENQSVSGLERT